jgi:hypothetical protein
MARRPASCPRLLLDARTDLACLCLARLPGFVALPQRDAQWLAALAAAKHDVADVPGFAADAGMYDVAHYCRDVINSIRLRLEKIDRESTSVSFHVRSRPSRSSGHRLSFIGPPPAVTSTRRRCPPLWRSARATLDNVGAGVRTVVGAATWAMRLSSRPRRPIGARPRRPAASTRAAVRRRARRRLRGRPRHRTRPGSRA